MELTAAQLQIRCSTLRLICSCAAARARVHPPCPLSPPDWRCCAARARRPRASAAPPPPPRRAAPARPSGAPSAPRGRSSALASARIAPAPPARWRAPWHGRSLPWHGRSSCAADRRLRQRPCPSGRLSVGTCVHAWGRGATVALFAPGRSRSADRPAPPRADQRAGEPPRPSPPMARSPHDTGRGGRTEPARPSRGAHRPLAGSRPAQPSPISRHHFGRLALRLRLLSSRRRRRLRLRAVMSIVAVAVSSPPHHWSRPPAGSNARDRTVAHPIHTHSPCGRPRRGQGDGNGRVIAVYITNAGECGRRRG